MGGKKIKLRYLGPFARVEVAGFGVHDRGEVEAYPEDLARETLRTSRRQKFEVVDKKVRETLQAECASEPEDVGLPEEDEKGTAPAPETGHTEYYGSTRIHRTAPGERQYGLTAFRHATGAAAPPRKDEDG